MVKLFAQQKGCGSDVYMASPIEMLTFAFLTLIDLLKGSLLTAIPFTLLTALAIFLRDRLRTRFKLSWLASVSLIIFLLAFLLGFLMYFLPLWLTGPNTELGIVPDYFQPTVSENALFVVFALIRIIIFALIITVLLLPFTLLGSLLNAYFNPILKKALFALLASVFCVTFLIAFLILYLFPFIPLGLVYFLYAFSG